MIFVLFGGFTYDLIGRKITIGLSFILSGVFAFFMPYTGYSIYPWLFVSKALTTMTL